MKIIFCCGCKGAVKPRLTDGGEIYPHRPDLKKLPFWKCDTCGNYVGCHHKTKNRTKPLGCIPTPEIREARKEIHAVIDPLWQDGHIRRNKVYGKMSEALGYKFHTANIKTVEEASHILLVAHNISEDVRPSPLKRILNVQS